MSQRFGVAVAALVLFVAAVPAQAGWSFTQTVTNTGAPRAEMGDIVSKVRIEDGQARIDYLKMAENPMFGVGAYMLMRSTTPKGMFLVNPAKETYMAFDPGGMMQAMSPMAGATEGAGMKMTITEAKAEKLLEEPGEKIEGYPTVHLRFRKSYVLTMSMGGGGPMKMEMATAHDVIEDTWLTNAIHIEMPGFESMLGGMGDSELFKEFEKLAALDEVKRKGFPLKRVTVDHSVPRGKGMMAKMMGGKEQTVTTTLEITEIEKGAIAASVFVIPAGYEEIQMMQPGAKAPNLEDED
jgi:hypothetical protein